MSSPVMVKDGPTSLKRGGLTDGSDADDEDIITKQLQADLEHQDEVHSEKHSKRDKKRKSRDAEESARSGADDKKRKKKLREQARKEAKFPSDALYHTVKHLKDSISIKPEIHFKSFSFEPALNEEPRPQMADRKGKDKPVAHMHESFDGKDKKRKTTFSEIKSLAASGRSSLGSNPGPLLESILKDCSPDGLKQLKALGYTGSASDTNDDPISPETARDSMGMREKLLRQKPTGHDSLAKVKSNSDSANAFANAPSSGIMAGNVHDTLKAQAGPKGYRIPKLPRGYEPGAESAKKEYHCPVEGCDKLYARKRALGEHMSITHADQDLRDNHDGTFTVVGRKEQTATTPKYKEPLSNKDIRPPILPKSRPQSRHKEDNPSTKLKSIADREFSLAFSDGSRIEAFKTLERQHGTTSTEAGLGARPKPITPSIEISEDESDKTDQHRTAATSEPKTAPTKVSKAGKAVSVNIVKADKAKASTLTGSDSPVDSPFASGRCASATEDWELGPGIVQRPGKGSGRSEDGEDCVAVSSAHIHSHPKGIEISNINFRVVHLFCGASETLDLHPSRLRICSVAAGKIMVRVGDAEFSIGANGMWRIKPKEKCTIMNLCHSQAVIHLSTLPES